MRPTISWRKRWDPEVVSLILSLFRNEGWTLTHLRVPTQSAKAARRWALMDDHQIVVSWFLSRTVKDVLHRDPPWLEVSHEDDDGIHYKLTKVGRVTGALWRYWASIEGE